MLYFTLSTLEFVYQFLPQPVPIPFRTTSERYIFDLKPKSSVLIRQHCLQVFERFLECHFSQFRSQEMPTKHLLRLNQHSQHRIHTITWNH